MRLVNISWLGLLLVYVMQGYGQNFQGFQNSNYAGVYGIDLQPASIADNRLKLDVSLGGFSLNAQNNYLGVRSNAIFNGDLWDVNDSTYKRILPETLNGKPKSAYLNYDIHLPSVMLSLSEKRTIAFTSRWRNFFSVDNTEEPMARFAYDLLKVPEQFGTRYNNDRLRISLMSYLEFGFAYGQEVYRSDNHYLKAGGRLKLLAGLGALAFYANRLEYSFDNTRTLNVHDADITYAHTPNLDDVDENFDPFSAFGLSDIDQLGWGMDLGLVYEFRPDPERYYYGKGEYRESRRDQNKYKVRVGLSLLDIGQIAYTQSSAGQDFNGTSEGYDLNQLDISGIAYLDSVFGAEFNQAGIGNGFFNMTLPTTISLQVDWRISDRFFVNATPMIALKRKNKAFTVRGLTQFSITPRWEGKWWGVAIPITNTDNNGFAVGGFFNVGPVIAGSANLASVLVADNLKALDFHVGFRAPIPYGKPKDKDRDGVPDKKDQCPDEPGMITNKGCPVEGQKPEIVEIDPPKKEQPAKKDSVISLTTTEIDSLPVSKIDSVSTPLPLAETKPPKQQDSIKVAPKPTIPAPVVAKADTLKEIAEATNPEEQTPAPKSPATNENPTPKEQSTTPKPQTTNENPTPKEQSTTPKPQTTNKNPNPKPVNQSPKPETSKPKPKPKPKTKNPELETQNPEPKPRTDRLYNTGIWAEILPYADRDKDGIPNTEDKCPDTPGVASNKGCPPTDPRGFPQVAQVEEGLEIDAFERIYFETGKAHLRGKERLALNRVISFLRENPAVNLKLIGHTDYIGTEPYNDELSLLRSETIKNYLIRGGLASSRIVTEYYGERLPAASNLTEEGRKRNRRVELVLFSE